MNSLPCEIVMRKFNAVFDTANQGLTALPCVVVSPHDKGLLLALSGLFERARFTSAIGGIADTPQWFTCCLFMSTQPSAVSTLD